MNILWELLCLRQAITTYREENKCLSDANCALEESRAERVRELTQLRAEGALELINMKAELERVTAEVETTKADAEKIRERSVREGRRNAESAGRQVIAEAARRGNQIMREIIADAERTADRIMAGAESYAASLREPE